jgi:O-antigen/teichoic acid export membrane protein
MQRSKSSESILVDGRILANATAPAVIPAFSISALWRRLFTSDVAVLAGGQLLQQALTMLTGVAIGRMLGASGYGVVNIVRNIYTPLLILAPLGLDVALLKYVGRGDRGLESTKRIVSHLRLVVLAINLAVALFAGVVMGRVLMGSVYRYADFDIMLVITLLGLPIAADLAVLGAYYRSRHRPGSFALMTLYVQPVVRVVLVALAFFLAPSALAVVAINTVQVGVSAVFVWFHYRMWRRSEAAPDGPIRRDRAATREEWKLVRTILGDSSWMALNLFVYGMMRFVDILVLGAYASGKVVGAYAALGVVSQLVSIWPMASSQTLGPRISRHFHAGDLLALRKELNDYIHFASIMSGFIFAGVATFGDRLDLIFGRSFVFRPGIAFLMPLGYLLSATLGPTGFALSMTGRHRAELGILAVGALILGGSCYLLVPRWGDIGAATAVCITFAIVNINRFVYVARTLGFVPGRPADLLPPLLALILAYSAKIAVDAVLPRGLAGLAIACGLYAAGFAAITGAFLLGPEGRLKIQALLSQRSAS